MVLHRDSPKLGPEFMAPPACIINGTPFNEYYLVKSYSRMVFFSRTSPFLHECLYVYVFFLKMPTLFYLFCIIMYFAVVFVILACSGYLRGV